VDDQAKSSAIQSLYARFIPIIADVLVKSFFLTKVSYEYTMNYLRQEKCLRDHEVADVKLGYLSLLGWDAGALGVGRAGPNGRIDGSKPLREACPCLAGGAGADASAIVLGWR
jgi:hypothetical protein